MDGDVWRNEIAEERGLKNEEEELKDVDEGSGADALGAFEGNGAEVEDEMNEAEDEEFAMRRCE